MRRTDAARLGLGALCLARPGLPLRWLRCERSEPSRWLRCERSEPRNPRTMQTTVRVLGARYVVQSLGGPWLHRSWVPAADAAVDLVHAASMIGLAGLASRHRRLALTSAAVATAFAVADLAGARTGPREGGSS